MSMKCRTMRLWCLFERFGAQQLAIQSEWSNLQSPPLLDRYNVLAFVLTCATNYVILVQSQRVLSAAHCRCASEQGGSFPGQTKHREVSRTLFVWCSYCETVARNVQLIEEAPSSSADRIRPVHQSKWPFRQPQQEPLSFSQRGATDESPIASLGQSARLVEGSPVLLWWHRQLRDFGSSPGKVLSYR